MLHTVPPDIREDDTRRMTYAELADSRGISKASAERLPQRRRVDRADEPQLIAPLLKGLGQRGPDAASLVAQEAQ